MTNLELYSAHQHQATVSSKRKTKEIVTIYKKLELFIKK